MFPSPGLYVDSQFYHQNHLLTQQKCRQGQDQGPEVQAGEEVFHAGADGAVAVG